jgi:hypothetical protein
VRFFSWFQLRFLFQGFPQKVYFFLEFSFQRGHWKCKANLLHDFNQCALHACGILWRWLYHSAKVCGQFWLGIITVSQSFHHFEASLLSNVSFFPRRHASCVCPRWAQLLHTPGNRNSGRVYLGSGVGPLKSELTKCGYLSNESTFLRTEATQ